MSLGRIVEGRYVYKSLCKFLFGTYRGAEDIMRKHIDWNDCGVLVLDGLADTHNWIP